MHTLRQKFGQMLMVGFHGTHAKDPMVQALSQQIAQSHVGWVMLLRRNTTEGPKALKALTTFLKKPTPKTPPLGVAIDGEGGAVKRLVAENGYQEFESAKKIANSSPVKDPAFPKKFIETYQALVDQLQACGVNFNLAPVIDVDAWQASGVIGHLERAFSHDPEEVVAYAQAFLIAHHTAGMPTCLKHWPGLGADQGDTHKSFTDLTPYWSETRDLMPFRHLLKSAPSVMVSHAFNRNLDRTEIASLSRSTVFDLLRTQLNYDGLIISDALEMRAASDQYPFEELLVKAILAGNDVLIFSNHGSQDSALNASNTLFDPDATLLPDKAWSIVEKVLGQQDQRAIALGNCIEDAYKRIMTFKAQWFTTS